MFETFEYFRQALLMVLAHLTIAYVDVCRLVLSGERGDDGVEQIASICHALAQLIEARAVPQGRPSASSTLHFLEKGGERCDLGQPWCRARSRGAHQDPEDRGPGAQQRWRSHPRQRICSSGVMIRRLPAASSDHLQHREASGWGSGTALGAASCACTQARPAVHPLAVVLPGLRGLQGWRVRKRGLTAPRSRPFSKSNTPCISSNGEGVRRNHGWRRRLPRCLVTERPCSGRG